MTADQVLPRVLLIFVALNPALAQSQADAAPDSVRDAALAKLSLGARVRVVDRQQSLVEGRLLERDSFRLVIAARGTQHVVPVTNLRAVSVGRRAVKHGAISGAIAGGGFLGLLGGGLSSGMCEAADCRNAFNEGFAVGALAGAAIGAVTGMLIGSLVVVWRPHWGP